MMVPEVWLPKGEGQNQVRHAHIFHSICNLLFGLPCQITLSRNIRSLGQTTVTVSNLEIDHKAEVEESLVWNVEPSILEVECQQQHFQCYCFQTQVLPQCNTATGVVALK